MLFSDGNTLHVVSSEDSERRVHIEQAGALCAADKWIYCACGNMIWKIDRQTLLPHALFGGGPGMNQLMTSQDGRKLYVLCSEGDSVLMIDAKTGVPMILNQAGVHPRQMLLNKNQLAIAGGESGFVLLMCAKTLCVQQCISMPGPVYSIAFCNGNLHAFCLTASLSSLLVTQDQAGKRKQLLLDGMPGYLFAGKDVLFAATQGALYDISPDGERILSMRHAPGRAAWIANWQEKLVMLDSLSDRLYMQENAGWKPIASNVSVAASVCV